MDIDFAFICDFAEVGAKVNALGIGFDTIYAAKLPTTHSLHLVVQVRASAAEVGDKQVSIRMMDADGGDVLPEITGSMNVPKPPEGAIETLGRMAIRLNNVPFTKYSQYSIHVVVQGNEMVRIPFRVAQPPTTG